jgi:hypothetical protein
MTTRKHTRACVWQHLAGNLVVFVDERGKKQKTAAAYIALALQAIPAGQYNKVQTFFL